MSIARRAGTAVLSLALLSACGASSGPVDAASVPGSTVVGSYAVGTRSGAAHPVAGVRIGLYAEPFLPGTLVRDGGPSPTAVATTDESGRFTLPVPSAGTWFVARTDPGPPTTGVPAQVDASRGAEVTLRGCSDCPAVQ
jgi:hypothetical protein